MGSALVSATTLFLAAAVVAIADEGTLGVIGWLVDPEVLFVLLLLNLLVATIRVWATAHAWVSAGGRLASLSLMIVVLVVSVPHAALGYYGFHTRSTLMTVFPSPPPAAPMPVESTTTTTFPSTTTTLVITSSEPYQTLVAPRTIPTSSTIITTTTAQLPLDTERFTVLLLGGDAGPGRRGLRTDTMIAASIDTLTGDATLFGLPRNMGGFTFSNGTPFPGLSRGLLNEVYQWGWRNSDRFGGMDPGASALSDVASNLIGIPIDHFVLVEMVGFAEIVDVLGGVTIDVKRNTIAPVYDRVTGGHTMITIPEGIQTFNGDLALAFVRSRTGSNDYDRMARQRCMLTALGGQVEPLNLFAHLPAMLDMIEQSVTTDIPLSKIPYIVNLAPIISSDRVVVVGFDRGYRDGWTENGLPKPDVAAIRAAVQEALSGNRPEGSNMALASDACSR
jgi:LCP family protein required for cell wall assembly